MKPYVFGHRGASGYEIENTLPSFKKAVRMGAGIETYVQETKEKKLICFHDYYIESNSKKYNIKRITLKKLRSIKFTDNREIPTVQDLFELFHNNHSLRYSFDPGSGIHDLLYRQWILIFFYYLYNVSDEKKILTENCYSWYRKEQLKINKVHRNRKL